MTEEQKQKIDQLYQEVLRKDSVLNKHVRMDLLSGSVKMGNLTRNNPAVPETELEDAIQSVFLFLMKMKYPWNQCVDETTTDIMALKEACLRYLTDRRIGMNTRKLEADQHHPLMLSGNEPLPRLENDDIIEFQDTFSEDQRLNAYSTIFVPEDPQRKSLHDYRKVSKVKAKCHPQQGHFARGWCQPCYGWHINRGAVPDFKNSLIPKPLAPSQSKKAIKAREKAVEAKISSLGKAIAFRGLPGGPPVNKITLDIDLPEYVSIRDQEYFKTSAQTKPTTDNNYLHASVVRRLNTLHQRQDYTLYDSTVRWYNQQVQHSRVLKP